MMCNCVIYLVLFYICFDSFLFNLFFYEMLNFIIIKIKMIKRLYLGDIFRIYKYIFICEFNIGIIRIKI